MRSNETTAQPSPDSTMLEAAATAAACRRRVSSSHTTNGHGNTCVAMTRPSSSPARHCRSRITQTPAIAKTTSRDTFPYASPASTGGLASASTKHRQSRTPHRKSAPTTPSSSATSQTRTAASYGNVETGKGQSDRQRRIDAAVLLGAHLTYRIAPV